MPKRFTDTDKWKKPFIRSLPLPYKLFWLYILDDCNHAGIWEVDMEVASIRIGENLDEEKALELFAGRVQKISNTKWFLVDFIFFQYGELTEKNRLHVSVINILNKYEISVNKPLLSPFQGVKEQYKDKDKDKEQDKDTVLGKKFLSKEVAELPKNKLGACKELLKIGKGIDSTDEQITGLWEIFKEQNLTGEKWYKSKNEVYSHFINWIKNQKINGSQPINHSVKTAGGYELLEKLRVVAGGK